MGKISYARLQEKYGGEFIAVRKQRILAHAKTMEGLFQKLARKGIVYGPSVKIAHVHPLNAVCIYALFSD